MNNWDTPNKIKRVRIPFIAESLALAIIPFEEVLVSPIGSVLRLANIITILFCLIETRRIRIRKGKNLPLIPMLIFVMYAAMSFFWCYNDTFYFDRLSTYGLYAFLILMLCGLEPTEKEKVSMLNGLVVGGIIASLLIVFSGASLNIGGRDTLVIFGRMIDPNILSYSFVLSLIVCLFRLVVEKKSIIKNAAIVGLLFVAIIICGSRGALVTCFAAIAAITINIEVREHTFINKLFIFVFFFLAVVFVYYEFVLTSEFGARFTIDNLIGKGSMGMANRDKIWSAAFTQIAKRPILGYGNGASMYAIEAIYRFYGTHNSYILVLLEFGIVGFVLVFLWLKREYKMCCGNHTKIYKVIFFSMLIFVVFVEGFSTKVFWGLQVLLMTACYGESLENSTLVK